MKILNKFIWSKKEPSNKNDIWFDGSTWRMYTEEAWQSFTLPVDAADKVAKVIENVSEVYQEKLNAGEGIVIKGNTISVDDSIKYNDGDVWKAIGTLQQTKVEQTQLNDYVLLDRYTSTSQMLIDNIGELDSSKADKAKTEQELNKKLNKTDVANVNGQSLTEGGNIIIREGKSEIIIDSRKLGEPIETENEGMSMKYSKEQFENAVGMSISEFFEKGKTSEIILSENDATLIPYYIVFNEFKWIGYYKIPGLINYVIAIDAESPNEPMILSVYYETADLPFATIEYVDEKDTQIENKLTELEEEVESNGVLIEDLQNMKIDKENDDYYPNMAVGLADNLAGVDVVDSEINFRRSGGGAISDGVARIESIKGNSVVWNQQCESLLDWEINGALRLSEDENEYTYNVLAGAGNPTKLRFRTLSGHKYLLSLEAKCSDVSQPIFICFAKADNTPIFSSSNFTESYAQYCVLMTNATDIVEAQIRTRNYAQGTTISIKKGSIQLIDLTKMFQQGNEPTTIEEFYSRIPMGVDLNAYNEGEVIHMDVQSLESQGVNAWDEEYEQGKLANGEVNSAYSMMITSSPYLRILPNANYYALVPDYEGTANYLYPCYYDEDKVFIAQVDNGVRNSTFTTLANAHYMRFFLFNVSDKALPLDFNGVCINLSDASINGKYFPYVKRTEDLAVIRKYFPQGMKSAGTAHDEIRYNKASGKWEKVVRIGEVDMGTLEWRLDDLNRYVSLNPLQTAKEANLKGNTINAYGYYDSDAPIGARNENLALSIYEGYIYLYNQAYTDAESFKAAMSGVMLYYELAEPIVTELDEADQFKDLDYQVWNAGTEKAIAEGKSAPLAADITYGFNAIGKIKELEDAIKALQTKVVSL